MALIKGTKSEPSRETQAIPEAPPSVRKGNIFRSQGSINPLTEEAPPEAPPEAPFEEGLGPIKQTPVSRVVNARPQTPSSHLPPIPVSVRIPTGGPEPEVTAAVEQVQQVVYQQPSVPVDQAIIEEAERRAQQIVQEAQAAGNQMLMDYQQQANQMAEQANQQIQAAAEQIQQQAQQIGFQQGYEQGLQQGGMVAQQQVYQQLVESREIFINAIRQRHLMLTSAEPEMARLAIKIAEKLVGQELQTNSETILGIVRLALAGIGDREQVSIRVNPADYDTVAAHQADFEKMIEGLKKFDVTADAAIDLGGCAIETNLGNIDARLNTRVAALTLGLDEQVQLHEKEIAEGVANLQPDVPELPPPPGGDESAPQQAWDEDTQMDMAPVEEEAG